MALFAVKYVGRRPLLITGCAVNAFCMLAFASIAEAAPNSRAASKCLIAFICIFCFTFAATWGPVCPILIGEVGSNRLRTKTVAIGMASNWILCLAVLTSLPYLLDAQYANLGTKVGFIFGSLTTVLLVLVVFFLPETKDRSLEEIDEMFINVSLLLSPRNILQASFTDKFNLQAVPTREFKNYVCTGQAAGYDVRDVLKKVDITEIEKV